jgi:hypothetical protein
MASMGPSLSPVAIWTLVLPVCEHLGLDAFVSASQTPWVPGHTSGDKRTDIPGPRVDAGGLRMLHDRQLGGSKPIDEPMTGYGIQIPPGLGPLHLVTCARFIRGHCYGGHDREVEQALPPGGLRQTTPCPGSPTPTPSSVPWGMGRWGFTTQHKMAAVTQGQGELLGPMVMGSGPRGGDLPCDGAEAYFGKMEGSEVDGCGSFTRVSLCLMSLNCAIKNG